MFDSGKTAITHMEKIHCKSASSTSLVCPRVQIIKSKQCHTTEASNRNYLGSAVVAGAFSDCEDISGFSPSKYKRLYSDLQFCYRFLGQANYELLHLIRSNRRPKSPPHQIEKLLDSFAFKVATIKDNHERKKIQEASLKCSQNFMAKRWRDRYYILLKLTESYLNLLSIQSDIEVKDTCATENAVALKSLSAVLKNMEDVMQPWIVNKNQSERSGLPVKDLGCGEQIDSVNQSYSDYEENDFIVPLSSEFLLDLIANHKDCTQRIKQQLDIRPRILHILRKEKDRRNQLKKQCMHLKEKITTLRKQYMTLCSRLHDLESIRGYARPIIYLKPIIGDLPEEEEWSSDTFSEDGIVPDTETLVNDDNMLDARLLEVKRTLQEEEAQQAFISKRLQRATGTVHAFARLLDARPQTCHVDVISHNKILINSNTCFVLDGVHSAANGNRQLFAMFCGLVGNCLHGHPTNIITTGGGAEELLLSHTDGLAVLTIAHLIDLMNSKTELDFYIYAFGFVCTESGITNLISKHPAAEVINCEHADPAFSDVCDTCVRIESSRDLAKFLRWLREDRVMGSKGQIAVLLRLVGQDRLSKTVLHTSWTSFYPLFSSAERDALSSLFNALRRRNQFKVSESPFTQLLQKTIVGKSRTIIVLNLGFERAHLNMALRDLHFANDAIKATTEMVE
ncbi:unnamed protein product [Mesocestoides corti]|uniref:Protein kinase domain-containing protein n=1 Tax=Mesocestoides corti TaxID=53468 RepID=A0A0R3UFJ8_MESCO|nr:unnamed protein product [Mesocestoides corti]